jgi:hypothetical protein
VKVVVGAHIVVFGIAIAVEGARRGGVTHGPVLIQVAAGRDDHGAVPIEASVSRTAHDDRRRADAPALDKRQRRDEPDVVTGVVRHRRVTHSIIGSVTLELRDPGQEAVRPTRAPVSGRRPSDVRGAAVEKAAHLKHHHDGRSKRERIRFNLGSVLAGRVREGIGAQLPQCIALGSCSTAYEEEGDDGRHANQGLSDHRPCPPYSAASAVHPSGEFAIPDLTAEVRVNSLAAARAPGVRSTDPPITLRRFNGTRFPAPSPARGTRPMAARRGRPATPSWKPLCEKAVDR